MPQSGDIISGRYELLDKLGAGAFGAVYRARQLGIDRLVAIKLLMPEADSADSTAIARFEREAKLSSSLEHPNTITIHDYGEWQGALYLVMEYVRGQSLRKVIRREGRMDPKRAVKIVRQILSSLHEAHARGIIHRDMKPANIMLFNRVGEEDVVKVLDFGIAKFVSNDDEGDANSNAAKEDLTVAGRIVGTPRYMSPEQVRGSGISAQSDLYSLGLIFFELMTGRQAVMGDSTITLIAKQLSPEAAFDINDPNIPAALRPIVENATAKEFADRYQSSHEFLEALDAVPPSQLVFSAEGDDIPIETGPVDDSGSLSLDYPMPGQGNGRRNVMIGVAVLVLLLLAGGGIGAFAMMDNSTTPNSANAHIGTDNAANSNGAVDKTNEPTVVVAEPEAKLNVEKTPPPQPAAAPPEVKEELLTFNIKSTPKGANVKDGESLLGQTPLSVQVDPKELSSLKVQLKGYESQDLAVTSDTPAEVEVVLKKSKKIKKPPRNPQNSRTKPGKNSQTGNSNATKPVGTKPNGGKPKDKYDGW